MKKFLIGAIIALSLTGACLATEAVKGFIAVNTEATDEINPTSVKISFAIENTSKDANTAAQMNKEASTKAINAVKSLVDEAKGETIKTASYYLNPQYNYKDSTRKITGYIASNTLQVYLKDTSKAGKVISTALANGANSVNNLNFLLEETNEDCNRLIAQAAKGARDRADKIAQSQGSTITGIKSISANCSTSQSFQSNFRLMTAKAETADGAAMDNSVPVEAGKTKLRAYVNAEFFIK